MQSSTSTHALHRHRRDQDVLSRIRTLYSSSNLVRSVIQDRDQRRRQPGFPLLRVPRRRPCEWVVSGEPVPRRDRWQRHRQLGLPRHDRRPRPARRQQDLLPVGRCPGSPRAYRRRLPVLARADSKRNFRKSSWPRSGRTCDGYAGATGVKPTIGTESRSASEACSPSWRAAVPSFFI
jgi:hypothetical protein